MININKKNVRIDFMNRLHTFIQRSNKDIDKDKNEFWYMSSNNATKKNVYQKPFTTIDFKKILPESLLTKCKGGYKIYKYEIIRCIDFFHENYSFDYIELLTGRNIKIFIKKIKTSEKISSIKKENLIFILKSINEIEALNKKLPNKDFLDLRFHDINTLLNLFNNLYNCFKLNTSNEIEIDEANLSDKTKPIDRKYIRDFNFEKCNFIKNNFKTFRNLITHHYCFKIQEKDEDFYFIKNFYNFDGFIYIEICYCSSEENVMGESILKVSIKNLEKSISEVINEIYEKVL